VLARLRGDARTRDIPVVVLSADATPGQVTRLLAQGATAYLTKPLDVHEFLALLDRLCEGTVLHA
jgi:CheY-like chemotaxis protein